MTKSIFNQNANLYWNTDLSVCPIVPGGKAGIKGWNHYVDQIPNSKTRETWLTDYADHGIGLLTGKRVEDKIIIGIDVDDNRYVETVKRMFGGVISGKRGKKGLTIFALAEPAVKKTAIPAKGDRIIDILARSICVLPPTVHPETGQPYEWIGTPLHEVDLSTLPFVTEEEVKLMKAIFENPHHLALMEGKSTHDPALSLMASLAGKFENETLVCRYVTALFASDYNGNTGKELPEMFRSAQNKGLGQTIDPTTYEPGKIGPIPMGYTDNGFYVLQHQDKKILTVVPPGVLMSEAGLCDLAPMSFWVELCPRKNKEGMPTGTMDAKRIGDLLMTLCRLAGPFTASRVRGIGIWRENGKPVQNLRGEIPQSDDHIYIRFAPLPEFRADLQIDAQEVLRIFSLFNWADPGMATLLLGWVACAPICGALKWRPHVFLSGPKSTGKSTVIKGIYEVLKPMSVMVDGTSSEAGIRQSIGADSRPVILDEFESDRNVGRMKSVLKLARSASSANAPIARGTPEGKALQFQIHSTFLFGAIIPIQGTSGDASRIVELELEPHENDRDKKREIDLGVQYLTERRSVWCHQMVTLCEPILEAIDIFGAAMPPGEIRHGENISTLLGAAFAAIHQRVPTKEEANEWIEKHATLGAVLAKVHEEDEGMNCLHHLLCSRFGDQTVGDMLVGREELLAPGGISAGSGPATLSLGKIGIKPVAGGFLVANKHPELSRIFQGTLWADGGWSIVLGRLPGSRKDEKTRARFSGGPQVRCTFIPENYLDGNNGSSDSQDDLFAA